MVSNVQMTPRDTVMLDWLDRVRIADLGAVRYALGALSGAGAPVGLRAAQLWVRRMVDVGFVGRGRPAFRDGSVVWASRNWTNKTEPSIYRQTVRHDVAVANVGARYMLAGYEWGTDPLAGVADAHVVDGIARFGDVLDLVEVELTPKSEQRYAVIRSKFAYRIANEPIRSVTYFGTPAAVAAVERHVTNPAFLVEDVRARFSFVPTFNDLGRFEGDWSAPAPTSDRSNLGGGLW